MYIVYDSVVNKGLIPNNSIIITRKQKKSLEHQRQVIVDDLPLRSGRVLDNIELSVLKQYYKLGETYLKPLQLKDDHIVFLVDTLYGYDLGLTLYLLSRLSYFRGKTFTIIALVSKTTSTSIHARLYAWLKMIGIFDIYFNMVEEGSFSTILVDSEIPNNLLNLILNIAGKRENMKDKVSFQEWRIKRLVIPVLEARIVSQLIAVKGKLERLIDEYKALLLMINYLLDNAPPEFWDHIRSENVMAKLRAVKGRILKIRNELELVNTHLLQIVDKYSKPTKFTQLLINIPELIEAMIKSRGLKSLYRMINADRVRTAVNEITVDDAQSLITNITISGERIGFLREVYVSRDLSRYLKVFNPRVIDAESFTGQVVSLYYSAIPICDDCSKREFYAELSELRKAYLSRAIVSAETIYPDKLAVNGEYIDPRTMHICGLINYYGYIVSTRINDKQPCRDLFKSIERALL